MPPAGKGRKYTIDHGKLIMVKAKQVLDAKSIQSIVTRLSHEIVEKNHNSTELNLIGIQTRGGPLAKRIQALIHKHSGVEVSLGLVDITFHRDDCRDRLVVPQVKGTDLPDSIDDRIVILVDDVLYTGRTVRAAIEVLLSYGRPGEIQLGDFARAAEALALAVEGRPEFLDARRKLAVAYLKTGKMEESKRELAVIQKMKEEGEGK